MKKILILFLFIPLFSCNDWLNVEPEDSVTFVNYFKSEEELKALHNGIASYMLWMQIILNGLTKDFGRWIRILIYRMRVWCWM